MTQVVRIDPDRPDPADISRAADCLRAGGLVAFPTETVYGLGVHAQDRDAVRRLFAAKGRPAHDPLIVHIAALGQLADLVVAVPDAARTLMSRFWPGPLTLVMRRSEAVPDEVTAGLETVAVRVPSHPVARALLEAVRLPIAAPSANLFSRPSPTRAAHVLADLDGRIDIVLDGGPAWVGLESTVLDLSHDPPTVLRPGAVSAEDLRQLIPTVRFPAEGSIPGTGRAAMASPGLLQKHYAPRARLTLYRGNQASLRDALARGAREALARGERVGVLATSEDVDALRGLPVVLAELGSGETNEVAARLYVALRDLDERRVDIILACDLPADEGLGRAIRDRLRRAATEAVEVD